MTQSDSKGEGRGVWIPLKLGVPHRLSQSTRCRLSFVGTFLRVESMCALRAGKGPWPLLQTFWHCSHDGVNFRFLWKLGLQYILGGKVEITVIFPFMHKPSNSQLVSTVHFVSCLSCMATRIALRSLARLLVLSFASCGRWGSRCRTHHAHERRPSAKQSSPSWLFQHYNDLLLIFLMCSAFWCHNSYITKY